MKKNLLFLIMAGFAATLSLPSFAAEEAPSTPTSAESEEERKRGTEEGTVTTQEEESGEAREEYEPEEESAETAEATTVRPTTKAKAKRVYRRAGNAKGMQAIKKEMRAATSSSEMIQLIKEAAQFKANRQWVQSQFDTLINKIREELNNGTVRSKMKQYSEEEAEAEDFDTVKANALEAIAPYRTRHANIYKNLETRLNSLELDYISSEEEVGEEEEE